MKSILKTIVINILTFESKLVLKKYKPFIIAVTGSVGKTSTKDAIYTAISKSLKARKSEKSFNSEIGVPLTILGVANGWNNPTIWIKNILFGLELVLFRFPYPQCLILEVGADHPNDIKNTASWLKPDIAIITKVGVVPVHVEFFPSIESVLLEKFQLPKALKKDGVFIYSNEDVAVRNLASAIENKKVSFGMNSNSDIRAFNEKIEYEEVDGLRSVKGISFNVGLHDKVYDIYLNGVVGKQHIYPILVSLAVCSIKDIPIETAIENIKSHNPPRGRMNIIRGINGATLIDDSYNSSPDALHEAIDIMKKIEITGKKILVIGDMLELGQYSKSEHEKIRGAMNGGVFDVVTVGQRAKVIARVTKNDKSFKSSTEAGEYLKTVISKGDLLLIKGSQSMRMERVTKALMLNPENAKDLLVRQDEEWLAKE